MSVPPEPTPALERAPPRPAALDPALVARGRRLFGGVVTTLLTVELVTLAFQVYFGSPVAAQTCQRLVPGVALLYFLWRGQRWASLVLGALFVVNAALALYVIAVDRWPWPADVVIGLEGALYAAWSVVLLRSAALRTYLAHQRD